MTSMPSKQDGSLSRFIPSVLRNIWANTKPELETSDRARALAFKCLAVFLGVVTVKFTCELGDPWSAPLLNYAIMVCGITELTRLIMAMRKPSAGVE
jgi:hypothetical protein